MRDFSVKTLCQEISLFSSTSVLWEKTSNLGTLRLSVPETCLYVDNTYLIGVIRLMALIDIADYSNFRCSRLVICVQRTINAFEMDGLIRDLGWVGFELTTLAAWTGSLQITSPRWLMLEIGM